MSSKNYKHRKMSHERSSIAFGLKSRKFREKIYRRGGGVVLTICYMCLYFISKIDKTNITSDVRLGIIGGLIKT